MNQLSVFRILTYILLPIAAFLGVMSLIALLLALANPAIVLPVLLLAALVTYIIACFVFLLKNVDTGKAPSIKLQSLLRFTSIISISFAGLWLMSTLQFLTTSYPKKIQIVNEFLKMQPNMPGLNIDDFLNIMNAVSWGMLVFSVILIVQIILYFQLIRLFRNNPENSEN